MKLDFAVRHTLAAKTPSLATGEVYGTFGLEVEQGERTYVEPFTLEVEPGQIVAFIGVSGSGKTSCLRQFAEQVPAVTDVNGILFTPGGTVIEQLTGKLNATEAMQLASQCGLAEAQLFLRYPEELSDGQQYRLRLAVAMAHGAMALVADEFLATLDRTQAKVIAFNIRKLVRSRGLMLAIATTHEDILEDLAPDHLVRFDGRNAIVSAGSPPKFTSRSTRIWLLTEALAGTGTSSRAGTTEAQPLGSAKPSGSSPTTTSPSGLRSSHPLRSITQDEIRPLSGSDGQDMR